MPHIEFSWHQRGKILFTHLEIRVWKRLSDLSKVTQLISNSQHLTGDCGVLSRVYALTNVLCSPGRVLGLLSFFRYDPPSPKALPPFSRISWLPLAPHSQGLSVLQGPHAFTRPGESVGSPRARSQAPPITASGPQHPKTCPTIRTVIKVNWGLCTNKPSGGSLCSLVSFWHNLDKPDFDIDEV